MKSTLLADIGGTHARLALLDENTIRAPRKFLAADYSSFADLVQVYAEDVGAKPPGRIAIAATGNRTKRQSHLQQWIVEPDELKKSGWTVALTVNDFLASAYAISVLTPEQTHIVQEGKSDPSCAKAILGPGTGLGLSYIIPLERGLSHIHQTHGGHMIAAAHTKEQHDILILIAGLKDSGRAVIYEDVASGRGLPLLYRAVCARTGEKALYESAADILAHHTDKKAKETLRLFHEFLGLYAHNATVTGRAYGGLYMDGGVLHRLAEHDLFDAKSFLNFLNLPLVDVVQESVAKTPVFMIRDSYIAFHGLQVLLAQKGLSDAA